jgi:hypothetical protein
LPQFGHSPKIPRGSGPKKANQFKRNRIPTDLERSAAVHAGEPASFVLSSLRKLLLLAAQVVGHPSGSAAIR